MKKYKILTFLFILSIFIFSGCSKKEKIVNDLDIIKQRGYLIAGVKNDSPPFGYHDRNGFLTGYDIEIANNIASTIFGSNSMGNIKYVIVNPQNRISKLNSKEVDIIVATMSVNNKRKLILNFSRPYFATNQKLMVRNTSNINNIKYFNNNGKLAVIMGTTGEKMARKFVPNAYVIGTTSYEEAYKLLSNKQIDGIFGDDCILKGLNKENHKIINHAYSKEYYAVATRKSDNSKDLLNLINSTIAHTLDKKNLKIENFSSF